MPPIPPWLWVFIVGQALAHSHTLVTSIKGVDPSVTHKYERTAVGFTTWTAPMFDAKADEKKGCDVTFFALVRDIKPYRLQVDGVEQLLDTSWTFDYRVPAGETKEVQFAFLDPVGGALLAVQEEWFRCNPSYVPPTTNWDARRVR
jgi:hypothetical protein